MDVSQSASNSYISMRQTLAPSQYVPGTPEYKSLSVNGSVETWHPINVCKMLNWEYKAHICVYLQLDDVHGCTTFEKKYEFAGPLHELNGVWPLVVLHYREAPSGWRVLSHPEQLMLRDGDNRANPQTLVVHNLKHPDKRYASIVEAFYEHSLRGQLEHHYANRPASIDEVICGLHRQAGTLLLQDEQAQQARLAQVGGAGVRDDEWEDEDDNRVGRDRPVSLMLSQSLPRLWDGAWDMWRGAPATARGLTPPRATTPLNIGRAASVGSPEQSGSLAASPPQPTYLPAHLARRDKAARNDQQFFG